jgi:hypothetical protein
VLPSSNALLVAVAVAAVSLPPSTGPTLSISSLELENPDHSLGMGCPAPSFRLSTLSSGPVIVSRLSGCALSLVLSRKLPLFFLLKNIAKMMRARSANIALMAMDAGSMVGLCEEERRPGGDASHMVGSEVAAEEDMIKIARLVILCGDRTKVDLSAVYVIMRREEKCVCSSQSVVTNTITCTSHLRHHLPIHSINLA